MIVLVGSHKDDDGDPCDCDERECAYITVMVDGEEEQEIACPECKSDDPDKLSLVCGDHGMICTTCQTRFTAP